MSPPSIRVLVVDDDPLLRWSLAETLTEAGCAVSQATDCLSALQTVVDAPSPFDVVLLDCRLPDTRDLSILARLREHAPTSAVIFMTAFGTPELVDEARQLGACRVVIKPFEMRDIPAIVVAAAQPAGGRTH